MLSQAEKLGVIYGGSPADVQYFNEQHFNDAHDYQPYTWGKIKSITIYWDTLINGINIAYSGGQSVSHGQQNGSSETIHLADDEFVNRISGRSGWRVDALTFSTNKANTFGPYGGPGGTEFSLDFKDKALTAIFGQASDTIVSLGFTSGAPRDALPDESDMHKTQALTNSIITLEENTSEIEVKVESVDLYLEDIRHDLEKTKEFHDALDRVNSAIELLSELLTATSVVPGIGTGASVLNTTIKVISVPLDQATNAAALLEEASKEIRGKIYTLESKLESVDRELLDLLNTQNQFITVLGDAQVCIHSFPVTDSSRDSLVASIESASGEITPFVQKLDSAQIEFLRGIESIEKSMDSIENCFKKIINLEREVDQVINKVNPAIDVLRQIKQTLKKTISVPYGFKVKWCGKKPFKYPCDKKPVYFRFTVWQVITGPGNLIKPITDALNKEAEKLLRPLLRKLNLDIDLSGLPGTEEVEDLRNQIESLSYKAIKDLTALLLSLDGSGDAFTEQILKATTMMQTINTQCHLNIEEKVSSKHAP